MNIPQLYKYFIKSSGVSTDTRRITPNSIFFALKGNNFNGNIFAEKAISLGACVAIVDERKYENSNRSMFYVKNSLLALQELAKYHREQLNIPIIGLTGSNGKTTTKELVASVLSKNYTTLYTQGNLNNHIGVPLTLLAIKPEHEVAVIEMGANHLKEIEFLCSVSQPDLGYITNFGKAHLEGFGGVDGVIKGKSELYDYLKSGHKKAIINLDDELQNEISLNKELSRITFSEKLPSDFKITNFKSSTNHVAVQCEEEVIYSNLTGNYNFSNIACAISIGLYFNIPLKKIKEGIESYVPSNNRSQVIERNNKKIVLDAYNANPSSMEASLKNFNLYSGDKVVILGDMFELGNATAEEHKNIAELAQSLNFEQIILIGSNFYKSTKKSPKISLFENKTEAEKFLNSLKLNNKNILIKGSRGMGLESLLNIL